MVTAGPVVHQVADLPQVYGNPDRVDSGRVGRQDLPEAHWTGLIVVHRGVEGRVEGKRNRVRDAHAGVGLKSEDSCVSESAGVLAIPPPAVLSFAVARRA